MHAPETGLRRWVYARRACSPFEGLELVSLLRRARARNEARGITGVLLHANGMFVQCLEGQAAAVDVLFARIEAARDTPTTSCCMRCWRRGAISATGGWGARGRTISTHWRAFGTQGNGHRDDGPGRGAVAGIRAGEVDLGGPAPGRLDRTLTGVGAHSSLWYHGRQVKRLRGIAAPGTLVAG